MILCSLVIAVPASASCFRLAGCDGWPKSEPIFAHQIDDTDILFVAVLPESITSIKVFWGDRTRSFYSEPLPIVMSHRYQRTGWDYKIRIQAFKDDGEVSTYSYHVEVE